jgi:hypothetical protein
MYVTPSRMGELQVRRRQAASRAPASSAAVRGPSSSHSHSGSRRLEESAAEASICCLNYSLAHEELRDTSAAAYALAASQAVRRPSSSWRGRGLDPSAFNPQRMRQTQVLLPL